MIDDVIKPKSPILGNQEKLIIKTTSYNNRVVFML